MTPIVLYLRHAHLWRQALTCPKSCPKNGETEVSAPAHLPHHLLYRILAYRLQADRLGDLDAETLRFLDRSGSATDVGKLAIEFNQRRTDLSVGTLLVREWDGQLHRVMVLADGFAWHDKVFPSLSKVAFAITGTRWNGPRFFGLRDNPSTGR